MSWTVARGEVGLDLEAELFRKGFDRGEGVGVGAVPGVEFLGGEAGLALGRGIQRGFAADKDRDGNVFAAGHDLDRGLRRGSEGKARVALGGEWLAFAARERDAGLLGEVEGGHAHRPLEDLDAAFWPLAENG